MRGIFLICLFCCLFSFGFGQYSFKGVLPSLGSSFIAGGFEGTSETLKHHYYEFSHVFPNSNPNFWNPDISWKNKYKNGDYLQGDKFFGSSTIFVWTTDGYHLMRTGRNLMVTTTFILIPKEKRKFKYYVVDALLNSLAFNLGFITTYSLVYRRL
jgi:hypothetical protein